MRFIQTILGRSQDAENGKAMALYSCATASTAAGAKTANGELAATAS